MTEEKATVMAKAYFVKEVWGLRPQKNTKSGMVYVGRKTRNGRRPLDDAYLDNLWLECAEMDELGLGVPKPTIGRGTLRSILNALADRNSFNPVFENWGNVKWDEVDRLSKFGSEYMGTDDTDLQNASAGLLVRGMVWRQMKPGMDFPYCPIVYSHVRGMGKSQTLRILAGDEFYIGSFTPNMFDMEKKILEVCGNAAIVEIPEVDTMPDKAVIQMDGVVTSPTVSARTSFKELSRDVPVSWIWVKTTNDYTAIKRTDTNRRDVVIEVKDYIDLEKLRNDRPQLIAQARFEFSANGCPDALTLPEELWSVQEEFAETFREQSPMEIVLEAYLHTSEGWREKVTSKQLLRELVNEIGRPNQKEMGRLLRSMGYDRGKVAGQKGWIFQSQENEME